MEPARALAAVAAQRLIPIALELGGKSPQIFLADLEDLDRAVQYAVYGIFGNTGQVCSAGSRLLVDKRIIVAQERSTRGGPDYLPLLRRELLEVIRKYVNVDVDAVKVDLVKDGEAVGLDGVRFGRSMRSEIASFWLRGEIGRAHV